MFVYRMMRNLKKCRQCQCDSNVESEALADAGNVG